MSLQKLKLVGCERFNFKGELYEKGKVYMVGESKANIMLRKEDEYGRPYFAPYVKPAKSDKQLLAEKAAALAIAAAAEAAAEEENVVVYEDGSEVDEEVAEGNPEEVEVDTDDDPDLDEDDEVNAEEVDVNEDRDDGTAVEV
jgi:hypothetical protein